MYIHLTVPSYYASILSHLENVRNQVFQAGMKCALPLICGKICVQIKTCGGTSFACFVGMLQDITWDISVDVPKLSPISRTLYSIAKV